MNFLWVKLWILHTILVYCQDQIPFMTDSNVYEIVEKSAIIYKSFNNKKWRYSTYDDDGTIKQTYILEGLQDLAQSYYLLDQNGLLFLFTVGASNYQVVDLKLLMSNQNNYLSQQTFSISQCQQNGPIMKYGTFYFFICLNPKFYLQEVSFEALQKATSQNSYSQYIIAQDYLMFDQNLLVYKGNIFTNLGSVQSVGYILIDLQYDLFLQNNTSLCKAFLDIGSKAFSCKYSYNLYISSELGYIGSKVFFSNGLNIIFCLNIKEDYFNFFDIETLNLIPRTGVGINLQNEQFVQNGYIFYTYGNSQYTAIYNPFNKTIDIQEVFTNLPNNYIVVNRPYYNFNFQKGNTIFLKLNNQTSLLNINQIYKMCSDSQLIQVDSSCGNTCPSSSIIQNNKCICKENSIISMNSCLCDFLGIYQQSQSSCQCANGTFQSNYQCIPCHNSCKTCDGPQPNNCLTCPSGSFLFPDFSCNHCGIDKGYFLQNNKCLQCDSSCLTCSGSNYNQCLSCGEGYQLDQEKCIKQESINSNIFTQSKVKQIEQEVKMTSSVSSAATQILSSVQNVVTSYSFGLISNFLVSQKLCYLIIVEALLPYQIYHFLLSIKDSFATEQYKFLNFIEIITNESQQQYYNQNYQVIGLSYNILNTSGSAITILALCLILLTIFYLFIERFKTRILYLLLIAYDRLICGTLIQYFQICCTIFEKNALIYKSLFNPKWRYSIYDQEGNINQTHILEGLQDLSLSYYLIEEERNAIIYKSYSNPKWRYSVYDQDGSIQQTYIIEGLQDLAQSYYLLDDYDLFLQNNTSLCKALLDTASKTFSCKNSYDLHASSLQNVILSKVFYSNGLNLIFGYDYNTKHQFFDVETLNVITRTGAGIFNNNQQFVQNGYTFYNTANSQYIAIYNPFSQTIDIQEVFRNIAINYQLPNNPYYNFNFQQLDYTCGSSCPTSSIVQNQKCICMDNFIILNNYCVCNNQAGFQVQSDGSCQCQKGYFQSLLWIAIYAEHFLINLYKNGYIYMESDSSTCIDTLSFILLTTIYLILLWQPLYICAELIVQLYYFIKQKTEKQNEILNYNHLSQIQHPSLKQISDNIKKLNLNQYFKDQLYSDYFSRLVSKKLWVRPSQNRKKTDQDQILILRQQN
ncbi:hypothetical protein ABPG74_019675 [Tetrahymena malaccensis]